MAVTIKDIAKKAGVSYSTVSRALNDTNLVKEEKRKEILKLAREMGYVPNQAAVNLRLSKAHTIGLYFSVIGKNTSPFVLHNVLVGVYSAVKSRYSVIVKGLDLQEPNTLNPTNLDGLLILSQRTEDEEFIQEAMAKNIPLVVINRPVFLGVSNVLTDEQKGMREGMELLLQNGHRKIAVIEADSALPSVRARHRGWVQAIREYGLSPEDIPVAIGNFRYRSGYGAAKELLPYEPTAILCFNDEMAYGARKAILEAGMSVPEDISLLGFDNVDFFGLSDMKLTTVERNMELLAKKGCQVLLDKIENGNDKVERIYMDTRLVIRDSVKCIK